MTEKILEESPEVVKIRYYHAKAYELELSDKDRASSMVRFQEHLIVLEELENDPRFRLA